MAISEKLIDKRVVERMLQRGQVDQKAYEAYLGELPDRTGNAQPLVSPQGAHKETAEDAGEAGAGEA